MKKIITLLRWSEDQYGQMVLETGWDYLRAYIPNDPHGIALLERHEMFWRWWRNHWAIRDQQFLQECDDASSTNALVRLYHAYHKVENLVNDIFPNAHVLGNDYSRMIGKLQKAK